MLPRSACCCSRRRSYSPAASSLCRHSRSSGWPPSRSTCICGGQAKRRPERRAAVEAPFLAMPFGVRRTVPNLAAFLLMPAVLGLATHATLAGNAQQGQPKQLVGHVLKPTELPAPEPSAIKVPDGFRVTRFAEGLGK